MSDSPISIDTSRSVRRKASPSSPASATVALLAIGGLLGACGMGAFLIANRPSTPYTVIESDRSAKMVFLDVLVPHGTTFRQIQAWHPQVLRDHLGKSRHAHVVYYGGPVRDVDHLLASGDEEGTKGLYDAQ